MEFYEFFKVLQMDVVCRCILRVLIVKKLLFKICEHVWTWKFMKLYMKVWYKVSVLDITKSMTQVRSHGAIIIWYQLHNNNNPLVDFLCQIQPYYFFRPFDSPLIIFGRPCSSPSFLFSYFTVKCHRCLTRPSHKQFIFISVYHCCIDIQRVK